MGYFVAYRHTGVEPKELEALLPVVCTALKERKGEVYCTYFNEADVKELKKRGPRAVIEYAFSKIDTMDSLFVVLDSDELSAGMLTEIGYALAHHMRIVVAKRASVKNTYVPGVADYSFEYQDIDDLKQKILATEKI